MKIELNSVQIKTCWDGLYYLHKLTGYEDKRIAILATKFYGLWQDSLYQEKEGGEECERKDKVEQDKSSDTASGLESSEQSVQQRVLSSLHEDQESQEEDGSGPGRSDPGSGSGPSAFHGEEREGSEARDQEAAVWDRCGSRSGRHLILKVACWLKEAAASGEIYGVYRSEAEEFADKLHALLEGR